MSDFRKIKKKIIELLLDKDFKRGLDGISHLPGKQAVNPLFSFFYNQDYLVRWRSITAMGAVVSEMAKSDIEKARVVMRRMIWNLNDESGGIGWGSPEAMGETMARSLLIADEYHHILLSYILPEGNFIEHEALQQGVLWGIARLAHTRPELVKNSAHRLYPYLDSCDPMLKGLAVWTAGLYDCPETNEKVAELTDNQTELTVYTGEKMENVTIGALASSLFLLT
jgi:hypothetical protein